MEHLLIEGGRSLFGSVRIPGAKNSALPLMAAALLCTGQVVLHDVPMLSDVAVSVKILENLGCKAVLQNNTLTLSAPRLEHSHVPPYLMQQMRSSVFYLAPVLARTGRICITPPGGCRIGARPIDIHLTGLAAMGATVDMTSENITLTAKDGLKAADFTLRLPSVGATETLLMAASVAKGTTVLRNAATEPEVIDLARFLCRAGAKINGIGTRVLTIEGQSFLQGAEYSVCPDRIVAATVFSAVAVCGGEVLVTNCVPAEMHAVMDALRSAGCVMSLGSGSSVAITRAAPLRNIPQLTTGVHPAFPTDAAPLLATVLLLAKGRSTITDTVFENRFACAKGFAAMGATVKTVGQSLQIDGVSRLRGTALVAEDLRGGAALGLAALAANGTSTLTGLEFLSRGYEDFADLFNSLGAKITHVGKQQVIG